MIPIYKPYLPKESLKYAHDAIDSGWISSHGEYLSIVKDKLKELSGCDYIILTNNGTSATHLIAKALEFKYPNIKNIIVPSNVYVAAWNMFKTDPIYNLIPVDTNLSTWNIDEEKMYELYEKYKENTALLLVHNLGNITPIEKIKLKFPNWIIIEDNCEGFLGTYDGKNPSGSKCFASSVSFFGNKNITSGEGGMFCTNDEKTFRHINSVKSQGMGNEKFVFETLGYNYRMTNIQAALLFGQLKLLDEIKNKKAKIFKLYENKLSDLINKDIIDLQYIEDESTRSNWMFGIRFKQFKGSELDKLKLYLFENDIDTRPMFPPIGHHKHFKKFINDFPNANTLYNQVIILPSFPELSNGELDYICDRIKQYFKI